MKLLSTSIFTLSLLFNLSICHSSENIDKDPLLPSSSSKLNVVPHYPKFEYFYPNSCELFSSLKPFQQKKRASDLFSENCHLAALDCLAVLINNQEALLPFRERAIVDYGKYYKDSFNSFYYLGQDTHHLKKEGRFLKAAQQYLPDALEQLIDHSSAQENDRIEAIKLLACYYHPNPQYPIFNADPLKVKQFLKKGLTLTSDPAIKRELLNTLAVLYDDEYILFKKKEIFKSKINRIIIKNVPVYYSEEYEKDQNKTFLKSYKYYKKIEDDPVISFEHRMIAKLNRLSLMVRKSSSKEIRDEIPILFKELLSTRDLSFDIYLQAYPLYLQIKFKQSKAHLLKSLEEDFEELKNIFSDNRLKIQDKITFRNFYTQYKLLLGFLEKEEIKDINYLLELCFDNINNKNMIDNNEFIITVMNLANIINVTKNSDFISQKGYSIQKLLDEAYNNTSDQSHKSLVSFYQSLLRIQDLIPSSLKNKKALNKERRQDLKNILSYRPVLTSTSTSTSTSLSQYFQTNLITVAQILYKEQPNYNNDIKILIETLKSYVSQYEDKFDVYQSQYILYTYYKTYKEAPISDEEALEYVTALTQADTPAQFNLSGKDIPANLRIGKVNKVKKSIPDSVLDSVTDEKKIFDSSSSPSELDPNSNSILVESPSLEENLGTDSTFEESTSSTFLEKESMENNQTDQQEVVQKTEDSSLSPQPLKITSKKARVATLKETLTTDPSLKRSKELKRSITFLERLKSRGKVTEQELKNMLDRTQYSHTISLHPQHKKGNNKKGGKSLSKAQKTSVIPTVEKAIEHQKQNLN